MLFIFVIISLFNEKSDFHLEILNKETNVHISLDNNDQVEWIYKNKIKVKFFNSIKNHASYNHLFSFSENPRFFEMESIIIYKNGEDETDELLVTIDEINSLGLEYTHSYVDLDKIDVNDILEYETTYRLKPDKGRIQTYYTESYSFPINRQRLEIKISSALEPLFGLINDTVHKPKTATENGSKTFTWEINDKQSPYEKEGYTKNFSQNAKKIRYYVTEPSWKKAYQAENYFQNYQRLIKTADVKNINAFVDSLNLNDLSDEKKVEKVYTHIQRTYKYAYIDLHQNGYIPHGFDYIYKQKTADCKDYSLFMLLIFRHLGYEAFGIDIDTRDSGTPFLSNVHYMFQFNHALLYLKLPNGKTYFLDGTGEVFGLNDIRKDVQGMEAILVNDLNETFEVIKIPEKPLDENQFNYVVKGQINNKGQFSGSIDVTYIGTSSHYLRRKLIENESFFINHYQSWLGEHETANIDITSVEHLKAETFSDTLQLKISVVAKNVLSSITKNKQGLHLQLFNTAEYRAFCKRKREHDYAFDYPPNRVTWQYEIQLPHELKASYLPKPLSVTTKYFRYDAKASIQPNNILSFTSTKERTVWDIPASDHKKVRRFFNKLYRYKKEYVLFE